jgi:hypothetical protein
MDTTALYKLNFATLDFEHLEHGRHTYNNVKKDFVGFLALNFWSGIHIYFLVMISLFVVLALGKAF